MQETALTLHEGNFRAPCDGRGGREAQLQDTQGRRTLHKPQQAPVGEVLEQGARGRMVGVARAESCMCLRCPVCLDIQVALTDARWVCL